MEAQDPLSQLADIHLPGSVSLWPLAPGWWVLIMLLAVFTLYGLLKAYAALLRRRRCQAALQELELALQAFRQAPDSTKNSAGLNYLYAINSILKRVALHTDPQQATVIPELNGTRWLAYLDSKLDTQSFSKGAGQVLAEGQYQPEFRADPQALYQLAAAWVRQAFRQEPAAALRPFARLLPARWQHD